MISMQYKLIYLYTLCISFLKSETKVNVLLLGVKVKESDSFTHRETSIVIKKALNALEVLQIFKYKSFLSVIFCLQKGHSGFICLWKWGICF